MGPLRYPLEDEDEDPPELARLKVPPLLPTMEFPVLSIVNDIGKFLLGVMYTICPDVVEPVSNVPLICVHPNSDTAAGLEGVNVHEFPLWTRSPDSLPLMNVHFPSSLTDVTVLV
jgi:hypothetical protein